MSTSSVATAGRADPAGASPRPATPMGLAAQKAPPFTLPGAHFTVAMAFLVAGAAGIVAVAPALADGFYASQRVIGVTHLFTLGWITTSIMGALYQFLPVALGEPIHSSRAGYVTLALYAPGLVLFVLGLFGAGSAVTLIGAGTFGAGILLFAGNLGLTLKKASNRDVTWWALTGADVFLVVTLVFGLALSGNLRWGYLGGARLTALGAHLHVALAGWVLLVMVGVAHRLLPMFLLSHGVGDRFAKASVALVIAGAAVLATLHHGPDLLSHWLPAGLLAGGLVCFLAQARQFFRQRHRPRLDPGMRLAAGALLLLAIGLVLAIPVVAGWASARLATGYVLCLILAVTLFVAAHYYKIVPFLVWYHRFGPLAGKQPVPRVSELYSGRTASAAGIALLVGAIALAGAVVTGWGTGARTAALVFAVGVAVEGSQMLQLARRKP